MAKSKLERRNKIRARIRGKISGTSQTPRLSVFRSNKDIYAQIINDENGTTLVSASSKEKEVASQKENKTNKATLVGKNIAAKALAAGISAVVFDRGGYLYHGRVKNLADGAREGGLKF